MSTIIAKNQTASALPLTQIPVPNNEVPASGQVTLTGFATMAEIQEDTELSAHIAAGDCILNVDGVDLSAADSAAFASPPSTSIFTSSERGLVPAGGVGATKFLRQDGGFEVPPGGGATTAKIACCPFGAKSDSSGTFLIANGRATDADDSSKPKTRHAAPIAGTLVALAYQTKEGTSTTRMRIHRNGVHQGNVPLANINSTFGGVEVLSISVAAGDKLEIEWNGDDKPGECTMCFVLEYSL